MESDNKGILSLLSAIEHQTLCHEINEAQENSVVSSVPSVVPLPPPPTEASHHPEAHSEESASSLNILRCLICLNAQSEMVNIASDPNNKVILETLEGIVQRKLIKKEEKDKNNEKFLCLDCYNVLCNYEKQFRELQIIQENFKTQFMTNNPEYYPKKGRKPGSTTLKRKSEIESESSSNIIRKSTRSIKKTKIFQEQDVNSYLNENDDDDQDHHQGDPFVDNITIKEEEEKKAIPPLQPQPRPPPNEEILKGQFTPGIKSVKYIWDMERKI